LKSPKQEHSHNDKPGEIGLPTEIDEIMNIYGKNTGIEDHPAALHRESKDAVNSIIKPVSNQDKLMEMTRSARILQRTINKKLNPLNKIQKNLGDSFVSKHSDTSSLSKTQS
jgi:hypothetical protein